MKLVEPIKEFFFQSNPIKKFANKRPSSGLKLVHCSGHQSFGMEQQNSSENNIQRQMFSENFLQLVSNRFCFGCDHRLPLKSNSNDISMLSVDSAPNSLILWLNGLIWKFHFFWPNENSLNKNKMAKSQRSYHSLDKS